MGGSTEEARRQTLGKYDGIRNCRGGRKKNYLGSGGTHRENGGKKHAKKKAAQNWGKKTVTSPEKNRVRPENEKKKMVEEKEWRTQLISRVVSKHQQPGQVDDITKGNVKKKN